MTKYFLTCCLLILPPAASASEGATLSHFRREGNSSVVKSLYSIERTEEVSRQRCFVELPSGNRGILGWSLDPNTGKMTTRIEDEQTASWFEVTLHFGYQASGMTPWLDQEFDAGPEEGGDVLFRIETSAGNRLELWAPYFAQDTSREARELSTRISIEGFEPALRKLRSPFFEELLAVTACPGTGIEEQWSLPLKVLAAALGDSKQASEVCPAGGRWERTESASFKLEDPRYRAFLSRFPSGQKHLSAKGVGRP